MLFRSSGLLRRCFCEWVTSKIKLDPNLGVNMVMEGEFAAAAWLRHGQGTVKAWLRSVSLTDLLKTLLL